MSDHQRCRLVGVRFDDPEGGGVVAEWRLIDGLAVAVRGGDTGLADEVSHGVLLDGPYLRSAEHIGRYHGVEVRRGMVTPDDGEAYLVGLLAWHWHRTDVVPVPLVTAAEGWRLRPCN